MRAANLGGRRDATLTAEHGDRPKPASVRSAPARNAGRRRGALAALTLGALATAAGVRLARDRGSYKVEPAPALIMDRRAQAYLDAGDIDQAERWWRRSIDLQPGRSEPWLQLGRLALRRRTPAEAVDALSRANDLRPDDYETLAALATVHRLLGHAGLAEEFQAGAQRVRPEPVGGMGSDALPAPRRNAGETAGRPS